MAKPSLIELPGGAQCAILYEDRSVLAIDKPPGWILAPSSWQNTARNLQSAITSSIQQRAFWARSRNLKYLRFAHRLDADTSGVLLLVKNPGAISAYGSLFESHAMRKSYLAVVTGQPEQTEWCSRLKIAPDPEKRGRMRIDSAKGKKAETSFRVLQKQPGIALVLAQPLTGRTHQIRLHLAASGHPVLGDELYREDSSGPSLALRAVCLAYVDPFTHRRVHIQAPTAAFVRKYGFEPQGIAAMLRP